MDELVYGHRDSRRLLGDVARRRLGAREGDDSGAAKACPSGSERPAAGTGRPCSATHPGTATGQTCGKSCRSGRFRADTGQEEVIRLLPAVDHLAGSSYPD
jgi:hypothetical protein